MCGIYVAIAPADRERLELPGAWQVPHRGPNAFGRREGSIAGWNITLAHWRLSIIDIEERSNQPMRRAEGRTWIVFNGEIYNYIELRREIGGDFATESDTEVLLAAYEKWGADCLARLRGMFAFVLVDEQKGRVFAARDRFGIKPLYYKQRADGGWEFASEIKQLLPERPSLNRRVARDFLVYGAMDHSSETFFDGIVQLRGGESLLIDLSHPESAKPQRWYQPRCWPKFSGNFEEAVRMAREVFFDTIRLHLRADVPLGFCLSGGMDSSAIVSIASALVRESGAVRVALHCRYQLPNFDESGHAKAAADLAGAELVTVAPECGELVEDFEKVTWHMDEPLANGSIYSQYRLFKEAGRLGLKVMLDGQGGDELLASYPEFFGLALLGLFSRGRLWQFFDELGHFRRDHAYTLGVALRAVATFHLPAGLHRLAKSVGGTRRELGVLRDGFLKLDGPPVPPWQERVPLRRDGMTSALSSRMLRQISLPMLLHWEDRNSMAHSIESRVPFLDHHLVELMLSMPDEFKIHRGVTKRVLKWALRDLLPPQIVARRDKMGFTTPEGLWLRSDTGGFFTRQMQSAAEIFPAVFDGARLREGWRLFQEQGKGNARLFWRIAAFCVWGRVFNLAH